MSDRGTVPETCEARCRDLDGVLIAIEPEEPNSRVRVEQCRGMPGATERGVDHQTVGHDAQELDHSIECDGDVCECPSIAGHNGSPASSASAARVATGSAPGAVAGG